MSTVLLDVDGTLVDSMYLHVLTWTQALAEAGHPRAGNFVQRQIGKDGDLMIEAFLGKALAGEIGGDLNTRRDALYLAQRDQLRPLPGAVQLVVDLVERGITVVLATSSSPEQRDLLLEVLNLPVEVAAVTDSDDVGTAKPAPDLLQVAMKKVNADPANTVMIGDAVWDIHSSKRAGIPAIGLLTGGLSAQELLEAGAVAVYDDAEALRHALGTPALEGLIA